MGSWNRMFGEAMEKAHSWSCKHCGHTQFCYYRIMEFTRDEVEKTGICDTCWADIEKNIKAGKVLRFTVQKITTPGARIAHTDLNTGAYTEETGDLVSCKIGLVFVDGGTPRETVDYADYLRQKAIAYSVKPEIPFELQYKGKKISYESKDNNSRVEVIS